MVTVVRSGGAEQLGATAGGQDPTRALVADPPSPVAEDAVLLNLGSINGSNVTVIYNHLSAYRSHVGQRVTRGEVVGLVGTTGWSTGCHTHFTVMVNGKPVNPTPWFG